MTYITNPDGSIIFPKGIIPPDNLQNYLPDPTNPRRFIPNFQECRYRLKLVEQKKCGATSVCWRCDLKGQIVSVPFCEKCLERPVDSL